MIIPGFAEPMKDDISQKELNKGIHLPLILSTDYDRARLLSQTV